MLLQQWKHLANFVGCTHLCCGPAPEGLFLEHGSDPGRIAAALHCFIQRIRLALNII